MDFVTSRLNDTPLDPFIKKIYLELPKPSLNDNTADVDRLIKGLKKNKKFAGVQLWNYDFDFISSTLRNSDFKVTSILADDHNIPKMLGVESGDTSGRNFGVGVDIGSTRLAFYFLDLTSGKLIEKRSVDNPQIPYGEDILTRIVYAREQEHKEQLRKELLDCCNNTVVEMCKDHNVDLNEIYSWSFAGNTTMTHFFLGLNSQNICKEPYIPVINRIPIMPVSRIGLKTNLDGLAYVFPNVGSYFGGDILAGILVTGMHRREEVSILVDVGTNAEVVIGNKDWLIGCAGAAGPALEGGVVQVGMMAKPGAIDKVRINRETLEPEYTVIGNEKPKGICGSGLIDLVAEMFEAGILDIQGKINTKLSHPRIKLIDDVPAYVVVPGKDSATGTDIAVTEVDIKILLKSKAAMFTILTIVARKVGLELKNIERFYVAGTFGNHIDPEKAITIGMLPDLPRDRYIPVGNTSGVGAAQILLCGKLIGEVEDICNRITYIELNVNAELMAEFRGALFIPHTHRELFPSVTAWM